VIRALVVAALVVTACAGYTERVRYRASKEFRCPTKELIVEDIGTGAYLVTGCGYRATYVCGQSNAEGDVTCIRNR